MTLSFPSSSEAHPRIHTHTPSQPASLHHLRSLSLLLDAFYPTSLPSFSNLTPHLVSLQALLNLLHHLPLLLQASLTHLHLFPRHIPHLLQPLPHLLRTQGLLLSQRHH